MKSLLLSAALVIGSSIVVTANQQQAFAIATTHDQQLHGKYLHLTDIHVKKKQTLTIQSDTLFIPGFLCRWTNIIKKIQQWVLLVTESPINTSIERKKLAY